MATTSAITQASAMDHFTSKLRDYYALTKPEVNLLILMTTSAGYYLASPGNFRVAGLVNALLGTVLVASGTATLNQWMERVWDSAEHHRRVVSCPCGQRVIRLSRNIDGAFVPSRLHPAKEENTPMLPDVAAL
jgi:heme O synthase-like polyprenyltransferase